MAGVLCYYLTCQKTTFLSVNRTGKGIKIKANKRSFFKDLIGNLSKSDNQLSSRPKVISPETRVMLPEIFS